MTGRRSLALLSFLLGSWLWCAAASALEGEPPSIWYRSADGCPDGTAFVSRLQGAAEGARLAGVADRIDFVVTLGMKDGRAFGRLERQTAEGRAAVRELGATTCDEVADAIALTLTLALAPQPNTSPTPSAPAPAAEAPPAPASSAVASGTAPQPSRPSATPATPRVPAPPSGVPAPKPERPRRWLLGLDLTADKGSLPDVLLGDRLFVQLRTDVPWPGATLRLAGFLARRSSSKDPPVEVTRWGARLEACPAAFAAATLELSPCLGFDAGEELARGTGSAAVSDSAAWLAASAFARGTWNVSPSIAIEAAAGPTLPLTRYELLQSGVAGPLNHTELIGFSAALGVGLRLR